MSTNELQLAAIRCNYCGRATPCNSASCQLLRQKPGIGWQLSDETRDTIDEIERHIRMARTFAKNLHTD